MLRLFGRNLPASSTRIERRSRFVVVTRPRSLLFVNKNRVTPVNMAEMSHKEAYESRE